METNANATGYDVGLIELHVRVVPDYDLGAVRFEDADGQMSLLMSPDAALDTIHRATPRRKPA